MICDHIEFAGKYSALGSRFSRLFEYLGKNDLAAMPAGEHVIDGDELFMTIKDYATRDPSAGNWETHRRYIDMQYLLRGRERMGIRTAFDLTVRVPYDSGLDRVFYSRDTGADNFLTLTGGMFVILFPQDAHLASLTDGEVSQNRKAIIKIKI